MLNQRVGRYRIIEKLAQGGMGEVYLAQHELIGRDAVIKVLHHKLSHDADLVTRFFNEAKAAANIKHPGIVDVWDMDRTPDGRAYIVMERLLGETLADRLERGPLLVEQAVEVTIQLAEALGAAHERNIVHRDLKPENIFLVPVHERDKGDCERVKVLDFGVAKLAPKNDAEQAKLTAQGTIFGTPAYMAPEQCADAAAVDHRADIYAIGCILYELLCGEPPFGRGGLELLAAHLRDQPRSPRVHDATIPTDLESAVLCLLSKSPSQRFQSCDALIKALGSADLTPAMPASMALVAFDGADPMDTIDDKLQVARGRLDTERDAGVADTMPITAGGKQRFVSHVETVPGTSSAAMTTGRELSAWTASPTVPPDGSRKRPSPTTYRRASGQIDAASGPKKPRSGIAVAALVVLAMGAGGAFAVVSSQRVADRVAEAGMTRGPEIPTPSEGDGVSVEPEPDEPVEPELDPRIAEALAALENDLDLDKAFKIADAVRGDPAADAASRDAAGEILARVRTESGNEALYRSFVKAIESGAPIGNVVFAYEQLPGDSIFHAGATPQYENVRDAWLGPVLERAESYVEARKCAAIEPLAIEVGAMLGPKSAKKLKQKKRRCVRKKRKDGRQLAKNEGDTGDPPAADSGETGGDPSSGGANAGETGDGKGQEGKGGNPKASPAAPSPGGDGGGNESGDGREPGQKDPSAVADGRGKNDPKEPSGDKGTDTRVASAKPASPGGKGDEPIGDRAADQERAEKPANLPRFVSKKDFQRQMKLARYYVETCSFKHKVKGKQNLAIEISPEGEVSKVGIPHKNEAFRKCIRKALSGLEFGPTKEITRMTRRFKFTGKKPTPPKNAGAPDKNEK